MRSKKHLGTLFVLTLLASMAAITLPATSSSTVTFRVENVTKDAYGFPGLVLADIYIDSPEGSGITGWTVDIKVNPYVLEPGYEIDGEVYYALSGMSGYFLYDWCDGSPNPNWEPGTLFTVGEPDAEAGTLMGTIEGCVSWTGIPQGDGASGTGMLVQIFFTYKSETAYSPILISEAAYYTSWNTPDLDRRVADVITHGDYNTPPAHDVAVTYVSAPAVATVGDVVPIGVEVFNIGANNEAFNLEASVGTTVIDTKSVSLNSLNFTTELFNWDTAGVALGTYTITAEATLTGDGDLTNNVKTDTIEILPTPPDVAVTAVLAPPTATVGDYVPIDVTVANLGAAVTLNLALSYDTITIETRTISLGWLEPPRNESFGWNATGVGLYTITAEAILEGDVNPANNVATTTIEVMELIPEEYYEYEVALVGTKAWPERHHHDLSKHGDNITLFAKIKNVGNISTWAYVKFVIENTIGVPKVRTKTENITLAPGEIDTVNAILKLKKGQKTLLGRLYVTTYVYYYDGNDDKEEEAELVKTFSFRVVP